MIRTSNKNASQLVQDKAEFNGSHTFARCESRLDVYGNKIKTYKVYSYGYHFPIYAYKNETWYKNIDKYSVSTSKHQSQLYPHGVKCIEISTEAIKAL